jgi:hypothetical protein
VVAALRPENVQNSGVAEDTASASASESRRPEASSFASSVPSRVSRSSFRSVALNKASTILDSIARARRAMRASSARNLAPSSGPAFSARDARFSGVAPALLSRKGAPAPRAA